MTAAVREALLEKFRSLPNAPPEHRDRPGYTRSPLANLIVGVSPEVLDDFAGGSGGELKGDPPKFCAVHSSSALAANSFALVRAHPERFSLGGIRGFTEGRFEKQLPTGLGGTPPNLDFYAAGPDAAVAVESKFLEPLTSKRAKFAASYDSAVARLADRAWRDMFESLRDTPARFTHLDAAQLVKHYLGLRHTLGKQGRRLTLLYVYWEPENASQIQSFAAHREEVAQFTEEVADSATGFAALSHSTLWREWTSDVERPKLAAHIAALRSRYDLLLEPGRRPR